MDEQTKQWLLEAEQHAARQEVEQAASTYQQVLQHAPTESKAILGLAKLARLLRQFDSAKLLVAQALEHTPTSAEAWLVKGSIAEAEEDMEAALAAYKQAVTLDGEHAQALLQYGRALAVSGRYEDSFKYLLKATQLAPEQVDAFYALGTSYFYGEEHGPALEAFLRTIELDPTFLDGYLTIADVLVACKRFGEAKKILQQAEALFPHATLVLEKLSAVYLCEGDIDTAMLYLQRQLHHEPEHLGAYLNLGALSRLRGDLQTAFKIGEHLVEHAPHRWEGHYHMGSIYEAAQKDDEAKACYRKAAKLAPRQWRPLNNLGYILNSEGGRRQWMEAEEVLCRACSLCPVDEPRPFYNLALTQFNLEKYAAAQESCRQLLQILPETHELRADTERLLTTLNTQQSTPQPLMQTLP